MATALHSTLILWNAVRLVLGPSVPIYLFLLLCPCPLFLSVCHSPRPSVHVHLLNMVKITTAKVQGRIKGVLSSVCCLL